MRCPKCGEYRTGTCDNNAVLAWWLDCCLDDLDAYLELSPEPGSRRWLITHGELAEETLTE